MSLIPLVQGGHSVASGFDSTLIGNSVWFDSGDYFSQDSAASDSGRKEAIFSTWLQRSKFGEQGMFMCVNGSSATDYLVLDFQSDDTLRLLAYDVTILVTSQVFRDVGWYHILVTIDTSQNSNASQKIFVNGEEVTSFSTRNNFGSSADIGWGRNQTHLVNSSPTSVGSNQMIGYMAQTALITDKSFQQSDYSITDFVDAFTIGTNGSQFVPKKNADIATIVGAGGNNSFLLTYQNSSDLGNDGSSKNNDFTANSMGSANQSVNTPSKVYSTFNPLAHADNSYPGTFTLSEGNTKNVLNSSNTSVKTTLPFLMAGSNIIRAQFTFSTIGHGGCGITGSSHTSGTYHTAATSVAGRGEVGLCGNGALVIDGNFNNTYTSALSDGDVVDVIVNCNVGAVYFAVDGTLLGGATQSEIQAGTTTNAALVSSFVRRTAGEVFNFYAFQFNPTSSTVEYNSGQSSFTHSYSSITSLVSLNTADLPAPTHQGCDAFQSVTYTGNGSTRSITTDIAPAWVWIKNRSQGDEHKLVDIVRGVQKELSSDDASNAEQTDSNGVTAFASSSFSLGSGANGYNDSSENFIAWCWAAGTAFSNDASATGIGTLDSSGRVNASDSLSIISYTGNATSGASIKHGLSAAPELVIHRERDNGNGWLVGATDVGYTKMLRLDTTDAETSDSAAWNDTAPSSSIITLGNGNGTNRSGGAMICYAFRSVPGVCKVGVYEGNNSSDGPYLSLGFACRWLLVKNVDTAGQDWRIYDSTLDAANPNIEFFKANTNAAQISSSGFDFLSDGVKARDNNAGFNSAATFVYVAMADIAGNGTKPPILGR